MLTALRKSTNSKVLARSVERAEAPFTCPSCLREVVLHKGNIRIHHFKHKPPVTCIRGLGETEQHLRAKLAIYDALSSEPNITELEVEKDFGSTSADVYARINGFPVAVEIQKSNLSVTDITERTKNYYKLGINVLWVGLSSPDLWSEKYSPHAWERWCHAAYFGRVYYWDEGQVFRVVHFGEHKLYVEERSWYESGGYEQSAGGYERTSKRYKTPMQGVPVLLSRSFRPVKKERWSGGTVVVPECHLYVDIQQKWWK
jgi:competence protein CoiA